ncbi:glycogen synthase GlgA [Candidatus Desantisbacteria bacterium CG_4_10_14_0_8_um_filter_39_17]|uniref:Glycogen synthase n=1 Tax=Candidatus Desantisbacteria bacterium CG_4_10_14_0_8_um_filter_39_17 TaxID=1974542 RepID=A0A2H9PC46_9BACT|nr:MAG: glycogen synthase GlgA [Candidatus Desantisbacteria bacterium CG_4_10_14_0_8_um_filter_39_17]
MKILIAASEVVPFAKTGGLADVSGALPKALEAMGHEVRVIMPKYKCVDEEKFGLKPSRLSPLFFNVPIGGKIQTAILKSSSTGKNIPVYFVENDKYFNRDGLYGDAKADYPDNGERFSFFCRAVLEGLKTVFFKPDVIHCNDWQTGLVPVYIKTLYRNDPQMRNVRTLYTIHNLAYQGLFACQILDFAGLDRALFNYHQLEFYGKVNFAKAGLVFSDVLNTVSEKYAQEIQTSKFGCGLDGVLLERVKDLYGIINGIDYEEWNPSTDKYILEKYDNETLEGKNVNKQNLQRVFGLPNMDVPLIGLIGRLAAQKGLDILESALPSLIKQDVQFVLLGKGDEKYEVLCQELSVKYPEKFKVQLGFDVPLSHQIYAGCDLFIMPSYFEPCGLGQLIALRYGTIPVVHATGGLADTISDYNEITEEGQGFSFEEYSSTQLILTLERAISIYQNRQRWIRLMKNVMNLRFSWQNSAKKYLKLYEKICNSGL